MMIIKSIYKYIFFKSLDILNIDKQYLKSLHEDKNLIILNLHRVSNDINPFYPSLSPKLFDELLKYITKNFNVITFREIKEYRNSKKPNIILSFDDGFYDFLEYTIPILDTYNIKVNLNIIPSCINSAEPIWDIILGDFLDQTSIPLINGINLPNFNMKLTSRNKSQFGLALTHYLKNRVKEERKFLWKEINKIIQRENIQLSRMLTKSEVLEISKTHEIGCHSYSHESMAIESKEYFENDFVKCQKYFKEELGLPLNLYTFPSGSYNEYHLNFLRNKAVKHILLVEDKYSNYHTNVHNRFTFYGTSVSEIKIRSLGWTKDNKNAI